MMRWLLWCAVVLITGFIVIWLVDRYRQPQMVANILNISAPPASLHVFECESPFTTDVLITCAIEVAPREFPMLLKGYEFERSADSRSSHDLGLPRVGPDFPVVEQYQIEPAEFKHGGFVTVFADAEKRRVIVDLYIE